MGWELHRVLSRRGWLWICCVLGVLAATLEADVIEPSYRLPLLLLGCFVCELVDSSLGMGYGTTLTPLLLAAGYSPLDIVPAVLISEFLSGLSAWLFHAEVGNVSIARGSADLRAALLLGVGSVAGVIVGVNLAIRLPETTLKILIGVVILVAGLFILTNLRRQFVFRRWKLMVLALVASFNKGVSGGGYGPLLTTGQVLSGLPGRAAVAITSFAESLTCLVGAGLYLVEGNPIRLELLVPACAGALLSVPWSAKLVRHLPESVLRRCIALLTCGLGLFILIRALG